MTRDGIWNIRNVAIDMVNSRPKTDNEKRFLELFIKINDRYGDAVGFYYPTDAFLKELKIHFIKHQAITYLLMQGMELFPSKMYYLRLQEENQNWDEFIVDLFGKEKPLMSEVV